ncbi:MAG: 3-deoxy-7-phosphoheptulonate synthase [Nitrospirae bacterium]|nr:3-deoxy-7-phosphoheptulonate synthase [Nitrospirota bacterium]
MIVVMKKGCSRDKIQAAREKVIELGYLPHMIEGVERTVIAAVGDERGKSMAKETLEQQPGVEKVILVLEPFKLASKEFKPERTAVSVNGIEVGGQRISVIAGPCSVESREQIIEVATRVKEAGAQFLRGGAYKPRTSPFAFQGLEEEGLKLLVEARERTGLPIVTEIMSPTDVHLFEEYSDVIQVGARNVQNFALLKALGKVKRPVLLKRGLSTTIQEFLLCAEYILAGGNENVILCERGIRTFETATRNTLDLNAVPVLASKTHLPIIVDPSHGTGYWRWVAPMAKAAVACGADGLIIEVHNQPEKALSDGGQSLKPEKFATLMGELRRFAEAAGRTL